MTTTVNRVTPALIITGLTQTSKFCPDRPLHIFPLHRSLREELQMVFPTTGVTMLESHHKLLHLLFQQHHHHRMRQQGLRGDLHTALRNKRGKETDPISSKEKAQRDLAHHQKTQIHSILTTQMQLVVFSED